MAKPVNYRQVFAIKSDNEKRIRKLCPDMPHKSGIYIFYRLNEKGEKCAYVGQAKDLLHRTAEHLSVKVKKTHIDKSLYAHKLYNEENPTGWKVAVLRLCPLDELDILEQQFIEHYRQNKNLRLYNVCGGGQFDKAEDVGERYEIKLKTYKNGKMFAYEKARLYVKNMFDKYLDYTIKGKVTKIKERKFAEFGKFLADAEKENSDSN